MQKYYKWVKDDLYLELYVQPRASKDSIVGLHGDKLKVAIAVPPIANRANEHLIRFLAKHFGVKNRDVAIVRGLTSRNKLVVIQRPTKNIVLLSPAKDAG